MSSSLRRKRLAAEIAQSGTEIAPCKNCRKAKPDAKGKRPRYIVGSRSKKCSECLRKGYSDCNIRITRPEWEKLRDIREDTRKALAEAKAQELDFFQRWVERKAKVVRLKKQLKFASTRVEEAVAQEAANLDTLDTVEEEVLSVELEDNPFVFSDVVEMSPSF